jgi:hypothetical protein
MKLGELSLLLDFIAKVWTAFLIVLILTLLSWLALVVLYKAGIFVCIVAAFILFSIWAVDRESRL